MESSSNIDLEKKSGNSTDLEFNPMPVIAST